MVNPNIKRIQKFLNGLINGVEREKLSDESMQTFKVRLGDYFSAIDGAVLEYKRESKALGLKSKWELSERSPLSFRYVNILNDGTVYFVCDTQPNHHSGGFKYFPQHTEFAFVKDIGLYVALSTNKRGNLSVYQEDIYLPEKTIQDLF